MRRDLKRVMLVVSYDGTGYCGWQKQKNGISVEEVLNRELTRLLGEPISVIGASRTDSGVHALGNVCVFDTATRIPPEKLSFALNVRLPKDIRIQKSREVRRDFHPRHCDSIKTYEYRIWNGKFMNPILERYAKFVYYDLNLDAMRQASLYLVGKHDFQSFCSAHSQAKTTVREITDISIRTVPAAEMVPSFQSPTLQEAETGHLVTIRIQGYGFLYNMVRIIAGTLLKVGMGMIPPEEVQKILEAKDRACAGPKAEAAGLTLMGIRFLQQDFDMVQEGEEENE